MGDTFAETRGSWSSPEEEQRECKIKLKLNSQAPEMLQNREISAVSYQEEETAKHASLKFQLTTPQPPNPIKLFIRTKFKGNDSRQYSNTVSWLRCKAAGASLLWLIPNATRAKAVA
jgi:hypothetical protein